MKQHLLTTVATLGLAFGITGLACAQDNPGNDQKRPANERIEKSAPDAARRPTEAERRQPPAAERVGQGEIKREEPRAGETEPANRGAEVKPATAAQAEPRMDEKRPEKRTGQAEATEKRAEEKRAEQIERNDATRTERKEVNAAARANAVRVEGNLHLSQERAERVSAELMRQAHRDSVNFAIDVGARLPDDVVLEPLPADIVELAPEYRGYDYVYVGDRIFFVQPTTHEVVGMINVGGNAVAESEPNLVRPKPCPVD